MILTCTQADQKAYVLYIQVSRKDFSNDLSKNYRKHTVIQIEDITDLSSIGCIDSWALIAGE